MGFFKMNTKEGPGVEKDEGKVPGIVRFFKVFAGRFWQIVVLNALYVFCCLPIVTIGPATAGLTYVMRNFSQGKPVEPFGDFFAKCKEHFKQGLAVFFIDLAVIGAAAFAAYMWSSDEMQVSSFLRTVALVVVFFVSIICLFANFYIYPLMVSFDLPFKKLVRNSIILGGYTLGRNIVMTLVAAAMIAICFFLFPLSIIIILFFAFSFCTLVNQFLTFPILVKYVAKPEEKKPEENEEEQIFSDKRIL